MGPSTCYSASVRLFTPLRVQTGPSGLDLPCRLFPGWVLLRLLTRLRLARSYQHAARRSNSRSAKLSAHGPISSAANKHHSLATSKVFIKQCNPATREYAGAPSS